MDFMGSSSYRHDAETLSGVRIHITGIVQGVGFRPFVYSLARRLSLAGWVRNTSAGVDIEVDGTKQALEEFARLLRLEAPTLARIDTCEVTERPADGYTTFEIIHSEPVEGAFQPISPDVCICADCLGELFDPQDRRYRYPFINCTNCGPRFTIIEDIPYDRPNTTMAPFPMCAGCAAEYTNPLDRRFHAQPVACPACGPHVWLEGGSEPAISTAQRMLIEGKILAVKGLGGFHLACDATNQQAVAELRRRKLRVDKPFAVMMPDIDTVMEHCLVNATEIELLNSSQRPIVLLRRKPGSPIAAEVAPHQDTLGVMLPYTALHYLLFIQSEDKDPEDSSSFLPPACLVMTSGNLSEEPIATRNQEARERLAGLADGFLMHNREIRTRCDDSVVRAFQTLGDSSPGESSQGKQSPNNSARRSAGNHLPFFVLRRSRGYAPDPILLPWELPPILAAGAELKNTFCLTRERYAFLSHHIGDLENWETLQSYQDSIAHYEKLFRIQPKVLAYDLHPNYLATRYALERAGREGLAAIGVQHHHAHIAACMAEHGLPDETVIGVSFDGTGYGEDGAIWGGEFLLADYGSFQRSYHLANVPQPGGDFAVRNPARMALAHLWAAGLDWDPELPCTQALCAEERTTLHAQLEHRLNTPLTSSMGRLFDAVSALVGVRQKVNYEAQAAVELEALVDPEERGAYSFEIRPGEISPLTVWESLIKEHLAGIPLPTLAARFHNSVAEMVSSVCSAIRQSTGISVVVLSGGVWQNITLLGKAFSLLERAGFSVYIHGQVPPNDGGLALGQAVVAYHRMKDGN